MYIGLSVLRNGSDEESIDKVFVIQAEIDGEMSGEISYEASLENDLEYEFSVLNPQTSFSNGFIEKYDWKIGDRSYSLTSNLEKSNQAPVLTHVFQNYGEKNVSVVMTDSLGKTFTLNSTITLQKDVELKEFLIITNEATNEQPSNLKYETRSHEYFIDEIGVPSTLKFDARYVRPTNISYSLDTVSWDVGNDKDIESTGKNYTLEVGREGNNTLAVTYNFKHRRNTDDIISLTEFIYIQAVKKDAILSLEIENSSNYAPVSVRFDASKSYIKDDNIIKFVYDYGDGIVEERDAINPGHRYAKAGDYTIKLTVIGQTGKEFSLEKKLILLPAPQDVKISPSLKRAPVDQGIDFSSAESAGQIIEYFWDFGDGNISTDANPSHAYTKAGFYTVTLRADFVNNNSISDTIEVEIIEKK
ncbi:PKD domain-containing protein [Candidatus Gracilibacteria bacterium]|nr:PKD domain-containing protein [Candidatus Gracilibacteria bacterium]